MYDSSSNNQSEFSPLENHSGYEVQLPWPHFRVFRIEKGNHLPFRLVDDLQFVQNDRSCLRPIASSPVKLVGVIFLLNNGTMDDNSRYGMWDDWA